MKRIYNHLDLTGDGSIEFEEFSLFVSFILSINFHNEYKFDYEDMIFRIFDKNRDGMIHLDDVFELRSLEFDDICRKFGNLVKAVVLWLNNKSLKDNKVVYMSKNKFIELMDGITSEDEEKNKRYKLSKFDSVLVPMNCEIEVDKSSRNNNFNKRILVNSIYNTIIK